jgi:selenoprotein W-related protein
LAVEIKERFQVESELVKLSGGVFEVYLNDELIYSKKELGRFPEDGEVLTLMDGKI